MQSTLNTIHQSGQSVVQLSFIDAIKKCDEKRFDRLVANGRGINTASVNRLNVSGDGIRSAVNADAYDSGLL